MHVTELHNGEIKGKPHQNEGAATKKCQNNRNLGILPDITHSSDKWASGILTLIIIYHYIDCAVCFGLSKKCHVPGTRISTSPGVHCTGTNLCTRYGSDCQSGRWSILCHDQGRKLGVANSIVVKTLQIRIFIDLLGKKIHDSDFPFTNTQQIISSQ